MSSTVVGPSVSWQGGRDSEIRGGKGLIHGTIRDVDVATAGWSWSCPGDQWEVPALSRAAQSHRLSYNYLLTSLSYCHHRTNCRNEPERDRQVYVIAEAAYIGQ